MRVETGTSSLYFEPVVYTASVGSLAAAETTRDGEFGIFAPVEVTVETGVTPPSQLTGLAPIALTLVAIPEPSTFVLGGLGAAAILLLRRRQ